MRIILLFISITSILTASDTQSTQLIGAYMGNVTVTKTDNPEYLLELFSIFSLGILNEVKDVVTMYRIDTFVLKHAGGFSQDNYLYRPIISKLYSKNETNYLDNLEFKKSSFTNTTVSEFRFTEIGNPKSFRARFSLQDDKGYIYNVFIDRPYKQHRHLTNTFLLADTFFAIMPLILFILFFLAFIKEFMDNLQVQNEEQKPVMSKIFELYALMATIVSLTEYRTWYSLGLYNSLISNISNRMEKSDKFVYFLQIMCFVVALITQMFPRIFVYLIHIDDYYKKFGKLERKIFFGKIDGFLANFIILIVALIPITIPNSDIYMGIVLTAITIRHAVKLIKELDEDKKRKLFFTILVFFIILSFRLYYLIHRLQNPYMDWKPFITAETRWSADLIAFVFFPILVFSLVYFVAIFLQDYYKNKEVIEIIEGDDQRVEDNALGRDGQVFDMVHIDSSGLGKIKNLEEELGQKDSQIKSLKQRIEVLDRMEEETKVEKRQLNNKIEAFKSLNIEIKLIKNQNSQIFENLKKLGGDDFKSDYSELVLGGDSEVDIDEEMIRFLTQKLSQEQKKSQKMLTKIQEYKDRDTCSICCAEDETEIPEANEMMVLTKCKHSFHMSCLENWRKVNEICPNCRKNLK